MALHLFNKKQKLSDSERHLACQAAIRTMVAGMKMIPPAELEAHIERLDKAETLGPVLDPTLWMANEASMRLERFVCIEIQKFLAVVIQEAVRLNVKQEIPS